MPPRQEDNVIRVTADTPVRGGRPRDHKPAARPQVRAVVIEPEALERQAARKAARLALCVDCCHYVGPELHGYGERLCDYMRDARTGLYPCPGRFDRLLRRGGPPPGPDCLWPVDREDR